MKKKKPTNNLHNAHYERKSPIYICERKIEGEDGENICGNRYIKTRLAQDECGICYAQKFRFL